MAEYEKQFKDIYPNGWLDGKNTNTKIKAVALQQYSDFAKHAEDFLSKHPTSIPNKFTDLIDVNIPELLYDHFVVFENGKWILKQIEIQRPIPEGLTIIEHYPDQEYYGRVYSYYGSGYSICNNKYCYLNIKIEWKGPTESGWLKAVNNIPIPIEGIITGIAAFVPDSYYPIISGTPNKLFKLDRNGDVWIKDPIYGHKYYIYASYLV